MDKKDNDFEFKFDFKKLNFSFFSKYSVVFLLLFVIFISVFVRMQPLDLPAIDDSVRNSVYNNIKVQIANQIKLQNPGVPDYIIQPKVEEEFKKYISQPGVKEQIESSISKFSEEQKDFFRHDNSTWAYMPDIDPYFWLRYANNILYTGHIGYEIVNGKEWDSKQLAPIGREVTPDRWHAYFLAYWYKTLHFFNSDITPERAAMYYPVFIYTLMAVLLFFIGLFVLDVYGAFFSSLTSVLIVGSLNRTLFGRADTDAWVLFFPVLTFYLFILSLRQEKFSLRLFYALLSGFVSGLFSYAWGGWWYVPDFIFGSVLLYILFLFFLEAYNFVLDKGFVFSFNSFKQFFLDLYNNVVVKNTLFVTFVYTFFTLLTVFFIRGNLNAIFAPFFALSFGKIKVPTRADFFPNVLTTVAELNPGENFNNVMNAALGIINSSGFTKIVFFIAIFGVFMLLFYDLFKKGFLKKKVDIKSLGLKPFFAFLILVWFFASVYASLKGIRFVLLLAPALSIAFGIGLAYIIIIVKDVLKSNKMESYVKLSSTVLFVLFLLIFFFTPSVAVNPDYSKSFVFKGFFGQALFIAKSDLPLIDDTWISVFDDIKSKTPSDSIITSWWDFGHHFIYFTNRSVTFDGTTQDSEVAHWVGRLFLTDNEIESNGILRMLDCSGSKGFYVIRNITNDDFKALYLLKNLVLIHDKVDAEKYLESLGYNNNEINIILSQTHCDAPEAVVIASADMIGKAAVWGHFGSWSFEKADVYNKVVRQNMNQNDALKYIVERLNVSQTEAYSIYRQIKTFNNDQANAWISPWPSYYGTGTCNLVDNNTLDCTSNIQGSLFPLKINLDSREAYVESDGRKMLPLFYLTKQGYEYSNKDKNPFNIGVTLINESNNYKVVFADPSLIGSMFTRMYYFDGEGLECYNLLSSHPWPRGGKINTFTSNWTCTNKTVEKYYLE